MAVFRVVDSRFFKLPIWRITRAFDGLLEFTRRQIGGIALLR